MKREIDRRARGQPSVSGARLAPAAHTQPGPASRREESPTSLRAPRVARTRPLRSSPRSALRASFPHERGALARRAGALSSGLWEQVEAGSGSRGAASSESAAGSGRLRACALRLLSRPRFRPSRARSCGCVVGFGWL